MESILEEIKRSHPCNYIINQLLKLTFDAWRQKVNCSVSHTLDLLEEFPFFKQKKWVYTYAYNLSLVFIFISTINTCRFT